MVGLQGAHPINGEEHHWRAMELVGVGDLEGRGEEDDSELDHHALGDLQMQ